jgi:hypothetical protein
MGRSQVPDGKYRMSVDIEAKLVEQLRRMAEDSRRKLNQMIEVLIEDEWNRRAWSRGAQPVGDDGQVG